MCIVIVLVHELDAALFGVEGDVNMIFVFLPHFPFVEMILKSDNNKKGFAYCSCLIVCIVPLPYVVIIVIIICFRVFKKKNSSKTASLHVIII
jgi:hypothetical protein